MSDLAKNQETGPSDKTPTYYVYDFSKLTLAELWRLAGGKRTYLAKFMVLLTKLRGKPMRRGVPSLYDNVKFVEFQDIPKNFLCPMKTGIDALESAGYI